MLLIDKLTDTPIQTFIVPLETREQVQFKMYFSPTQLSWYFDFTYNDSEYNGHKLVLGRNILRNYKNIIPFGLAVQAEKGIEPYKIDDFSSGRVKLYILEETDVLEIERNVFNQ